MFRPYMWAIFRLRSNFSGVALQDVGGVFWVLGFGWGDLVCLNSGYHGHWGCYKWTIISFLCTRVKVGFYSYAKVTNSNISLA